MFERKHTLRTFGLMFAAGAVTGAAAALLYAPMTGKKMQRKVSDVTDRVIDRVDDLKSAVRRVTNA